MTKKQIGIVAGVGLLVLVAGGLIVGRNFVSDARLTKIDQSAAPTEIAEIMKLKEVSKLTRSGDFTGEDSFHFGSGQASIYVQDDKPTLVLEEDFKVRSGPDLVIYLSKNNVEAGEKLGDFVSLGALKSNTGKQAYNLPADYQDYNSVIIWCRAFGVQFSAADIQ